MPSDFKMYAAKTDAVWEPGTDKIVDWLQVPAHADHAWSQARFIIFSDTVDIRQLMMLQVACLYIPLDLAEAAKDPTASVWGDDGDDPFGKEHLKELLDKHVYKTAGMYVTNTALTESAEGARLGDADTSLMFQPGQLHLGTYQYLENAPPVFEVRHMVLGFMAGKGFRPGADDMQIMHADFTVNTQRFQMPGPGYLVWVFTNPATVPDNQFEFGSTIDTWENLERLLAIRRNKLTGELQYASELVAERALVSIVKQGDAAADNDPLEFLVQPEMNVVGFRQSYFTRDIHDGPAVVSAV